MRITYQMFFSNPARLSDEEFYRKEMDLALLAEPLGFDGIWCVEHHFDSDYAMSPDNVLVLGYLAARTEKVTLTTGAVIVPWNDPLRVAEKISVLDQLSGGRVQLGIGRGLAKIEYNLFGIDMAESRERFDEASAMILSALEKGVISGDGPFYPQAEAPIRPGPRRDFNDRTVCIAMSPDSREQAADMGVAISTFSQFPLEVHIQGFEEYRARFQEKHGRPAPPVTMSDQVYCSEDADECAATAREYTARHLALALKHYKFDDAEHFRNLKGYQSYTAAAEQMAAAGQEAASEGYYQTQLTGTPDQIVERIQHRREQIGEYHQNCGFSFAGLPHDKAEKSMRLFATEVLPRLEKLGLREPSA
ncbi:LLM class flavin-dependent oxidoreductase [Pseudonocardia sp. NPDC049154]|uniref:LLM class flavin-dependent oxidoreductase n=1 Tax=Pseudonocardia sp. NPDC049154 TaxID=3155501 RepID=UPI0033FB9476